MAGRHETFTAAYTCSFLNIPIVHIKKVAILQMVAQEMIYLDTQLQN